MNVDQKEIFGSPLPRHTVVKDFACWLKQTPMTAS